jgi:ribosome biogenesis GTPase A
MAIQWFPGHMHLTRKAIEDRIKEIDVVIELLDARLPGSSANPMLAQLTGHKPALKVLNKQDLADPERTALWLDHYNALPTTKAVGVSAKKKTDLSKIVKAAMSLAGTKGSSAPCNASTLALMFLPSAGVGESSPPWKLTTPSTLAPERASSITVVPPKQ